AREQPLMDPVVVSGEPTCRLRQNPGSSQPAVIPEHLPHSDLEPRLTSDEVQKLLPRIGTRFLGFHLVAELGRGASGRVYLARQKPGATGPAPAGIGPVWPRSRTSTTRRRRSRRRRRPAS